MNYRHTFHAGNFADVHKHVVLTRVLEHLGAKPAAFRVIDSHAGAGRYHLASGDAAKTGEWRDGVAKVMAATFAPGADALIAPYRAMLESMAGVYPGSPLITQLRLRAQDRLIACEIEPSAVRGLAQTLGRDRRCKAIAIDGWTAVSAYVPPKERRGLVLVDPPYEQADDFDRLARSAVAAWRKWPTGIYLLWYPGKDHAAGNRLARQLADGVASSGILRADLSIAPRADERLTRSGLIVVNPPWRLHDELAVLLPALAAAMAGRAGSFALDWVRAPR